MIWAPILINLKLNISVYRLQKYYSISLLVWQVGTQMKNSSSSTWGEEKQSNNKEKKKQQNNTNQPTKLPTNKQNQADRQRQSKTKNLHIFTTHTCSSSSIGWRCKPCWSIQPILQQNVTTLHKDFSWQPWRIIISRISLEVGNYSILAEGRLASAIHICVKPWLDCSNNVCLFPKSIVLKKTQLAQNSCIASYQEYTLSQMH